MFEGDLDVLLAFVFPKFAFTVVFFTADNTTHFLCSFLAMSRTLAHWLVINHFTSMVSRARQRLARS